MKSAAFAGVILDLNISKIERNFAIYHFFLIPKLVQILLRRDDGAPSDVF